jgi:hypothetical protein
MTSPSEPISEWRRYPDAEGFLLAKVADYADTMPQARVLQADLLMHTSSRLIDWLDHLVLADGGAARGQLIDFGFEREAVPAEPGHVIFYHPGATFPRVVLRAETGLEPGSVVAIAIQVEDVSEFLMTHHLTARVDGTPLSPYRRARAWQGERHEFWAVERRGHSGFIPLELPPDHAERYLRGFERWATRPRTFDDSREGLAQTRILARSLVSELGTDTAAWVAFAAERAYWQRRNRAGQIQKGRQDRLGVGWANHDHHTFRSSRAVFGQLIQILETFGFRPRERFYAGKEAGWGAQVMEQPVCRFAVFADVDLAPDEVSEDFAHRPLEPRKELGTVGLWCALHGESMLTAGLHHLAGRFDFDSATADLADWGVVMMEPFSKFSFLRQAFTRAERWAVPAERLERLVALGSIDHVQAERFSQEGAVGSHLENIQRGEGFKGFNQQTVSDIIRRTDPRLEAGAA